MNFFVIGLPRSRTAWLANFLTHEQHCFHDGFNGCHSIADYKKKLGENKGDSSTGLMLIDVNKIFPDAPVVIIESGTEKAIKYGYKTLGHYDPNYYYLLQTNLDKIKGLRIMVDEIDDHLPDIWNHLIGTPFNYERAEMLKQLNIQVKDPFAINPEAAKDLWNSLNLTCQ